jgi:hypothetical protein
MAFFHGNSNAMKFKQGSLSYLSIFKPPKNPRCTTVEGGHIGATEGKFMKIACSHIELK